MKKTLLMTATLVVANALSAFAVADTYLVINLSGGPNAASYPVRYSSTPPNLGNDTCRTTELWLRRIPAGSFWMGSPDNELGRSDREELHQVTLTQDFYIGVFEVTQKQYELVTGINPSYYKGDTRPVESVSYDEIRGSTTDKINWPLKGSKVKTDTFMGRIRAKTGLTFDLPTEAQWEYACRADTTTALNSGKNLTATEQCPNMAEVGRYYYNQNDGKGGYSPDTKVGMYLPNAYGLYDMHGNVLEWCLDWWQPYLGTSAVVDPKGAVSGSGRLIRGGSRSYYANYCRSASRLNTNPINSMFGVGVRACVLLSPIPGPYLSNPDGSQGHSPSMTTAYDGFVYDDYNRVRGTMTLNATMTVRLDKKSGIATTNWTFSAKTILQNATVSFSGKKVGVADRFIVTTKTLENLDLIVEGDRFYGVISGGKIGGTFNVDGARNVFANRKDLVAQRRLDEVRGLYNVALKGSGDGGIRDTMGYLSLSVGNLGAVKIAGKLGDGTSVSGSAKLLEGLNEDGWYAIALHSPLYSKKGFIGGLLWLNPTDKVIRVDTDNEWFVDWWGPLVPINFCLDWDLCKKWLLPAFSHELDVTGGYFGDGMNAPELPGKLLIVAYKNGTLPTPVSNLADGKWMPDSSWWYFLMNVPRTGTGNNTKLSLDSATPPKKIGTTHFEYDGANPCAVTISYTPKTGLFKGSFKLYYEGFDAKGVKLMTFNVPYSGVMVNGKGPGYGVGTATIDKQKFSIPIFMMENHEFILDLF